MCSSRRVDAPDELLTLARRIDAPRAVWLERRLGGIADPRARARAILVATAFPAFGPTIEAGTVPAAPLARTRAELDLVAAPLSSIEDRSALRCHLRRLAQSERMRIALRELLPPSLGGAPFQETARELSELAEVTIGVALAEAIRSVTRRYGRPQAHDGEAGKLTVLGMGKLGGSELNAGSDVDLVCFYDSDERVARDASGYEHDAHAVWTRVVRRMTSTLEEVTEDGFVWRVDLRLRPEGARGALVNSIAAAERYYESFGRLWERAALSRARPVAGDIGLGELILRMLAPFVWIKRVDPTIAPRMYELVHRARVELSRGPAHDLKLGPGGIREAEFFVQTLQLIWGGRLPRLRERSTLVAVERLRAAGLVNDRECRALTNAYVAFRRAEHAIQNATGVQTHNLPADARSLGRIARLLGFVDAPALIEDLARHARHVSLLLKSLLPEGEWTGSRWSDALQALDRGDLDALSIALAAADIPDLDVQHTQLARDLFETSRLHPDGPLGSRTRETHRRLVDTVLEAVAGAADPAQAARALRGFVSRLSHPAVYTKMLADDAAAVRRLITVMGASAFVGDAVAAQPELGDLVLFERALPTPEDASAEALATLSAAPGEPDDVEARVGRLRRAKSRVTIRVALADLAADLDVKSATLTLSALADGSLEVATRWALGVPASEPVRGLSVLAMGKLGGREIGYGSDLDVIFLYDASTTFDDPLAHFSRAARKIIQLISMPHAEGTGYELDTRLRPSGSQGLLVASLDAFERYHEGEHAATWERLALLRARFAAGDPTLGERAMAVATRAAYERPDPIDVVAHDVHRLRMRMEHELAREQGGRYDLKFGKGGLVDIQFAVQLLQLEHGHDVRVRTSETATAITALGRIGALDANQVAALRDGHAFLRRLEQRIRVLHADAAHLIEDSAAGLLPLARRMGLVDEPARPAGDALIAQYRQVTGRVRQCYEQIVVERASRATVP